MKMRTEILSLVIFSLASSDSLSQIPSLCIESLPLLEWRLQTDSSSTFFLRNSNDLEDWNYTSNVIVGDGSDVSGAIAADPSGREFFRYVAAPTNYPAVLDTDGDGETDAYEIANGTEPLDNLEANEIYLEAEYPTTAQNYFQVIETSEEGYSGDGHLQSFGNTVPGTYDGTSSDLATYDFSVTASGNYNIFFRIDHDVSFNNDSWFYRLDTGSWTTENSRATNGNNAFHWVGGVTNPVALTAGQIHTLEIANREDGLAMDKIAILPVGVPTPQDFGELAMNLPVTANYSVGQRIIATHHDEAVGLSGTSGRNIGFFDQEDYFTFNNVDFTDVKTIVLEYTKGNTGGQFELRRGGVNGTLLGTYNPGATLGWSNYVHRPLAITETTGIDSLTVVGVSGFGIGNIRSLKLSSEVTPDLGPLEVGLHPGDLNGTITNGVDGYESALDVTFDHVLVFQGIDVLDYSVISDYLDGGHDVVLNLEFFESVANLEEIVDGDYDTLLDSFLTEIVNDGRGDRISIRTLHEFNGNWYNWSVFYEVEQAGSTAVDAIANFKAAWIYLADKFRDPVTGDPDIKFQLNYNFHTVSGYPTLTFENFYPGDAYVDLVVVTCYNRSALGLNPGNEPWKEFFENFENSYRQIVSFTDLPIGVAETSSSSYNGDKVEWLTDAWNSMAFEYPRLQRVDWFFENKLVPGENLRDWDLNTADQIQAFKDGYDIFKASR